MTMGITCLCPKCKAFFMLSKWTKRKNIYHLENPDFTLKVFIHAYFSTQINVTHIFRYNRWKANVKTLLLVAQRFDHEPDKLAFFYHKHNRFSFTSVKICSFRPKMGGNHLFRQQTISAPIDDIHASKAVDNSF